MSEPAVALPVRPFRRRAPLRALGSPASAHRPRRRGLAVTLRPYVQIARPDHWFKNLFMVLGVVLAFFHAGADLAWWPSFTALVQAVVATCLIASSNYTLNEWIDAPSDRAHPVKRLRPAALGLVHPVGVVIQWLGLATIGVLLAFGVNQATGLAALALWVMGCLYNIPPIRTKEVAYLDVLTESVNNPIRLLIGWHALVPGEIAPPSLTISYWMVGAFFMAAKRFAEYRAIGDPVIAARYRRSFAHYDEPRLLVSMMFYVTTCAFFGGVFLVRYRLELVLAIPFVAAFCAWYLRLALIDDSPVQHPERLWRQRAFCGFASLCVVVFCAAMFIELPWLNDWFGLPIDRGPWDGLAMRSVTPAPN